MTHTKAVKSKKLFLTLLVLVFVFGGIIGGMKSAKAEDNTGTVPGNPVYTTDAFYYSDQYMWKASLYVAKSDTVNKETSTINDFHRIGNQAVYLSPITNWNEWKGGSRPSTLSNTYFTKENKADTLNELDNKSGDPQALNPIDFTSSSNVYMMLGVPNLPYSPQFCDGNIYDNGVIYNETVGNINTVINYFNNPDTMYRLLNFYASKEGKNVDQLLQSLELTINGETRTGWNAKGILPNTLNGNPTNQVEWLVIYEPVAIVYVKDIARPGSYFGYALTATDFSVSQLKKQMDWRYDETRWPAWAGQQLDAWKPNDQRQHVSRLSHLLVGNSVVIKDRWYGFDSGSKVDQNAGVPNNRWTSEDQLRYGGWGMSRWIKPLEYDKPKDYEFRPNTDVIIAAPVFSNIDAKPEDKVTVQFEINGETMTDVIESPYKRTSTSYVKWHTPDVLTDTTYDLKISILEFPRGTVLDGSEYANKKVVIRPLDEKTPPDPKVDDQRPGDLNPDIPKPPVEDSGGANHKGAVIKSIKNEDPGVIFKNDKVLVEIKTNMATKTLDFKSDTVEAKQLTKKELGNGILIKYTESPLSDEITWKIEFTPKKIGDNTYLFTPTNPNTGAGESKSLSIHVSEKEPPVIISMSRNPDVLENMPLEPIMITVNTNSSTDYLTMKSSLTGINEKIFPEETSYSDEAVRGYNKGMDQNSDKKIDNKDVAVISDHIADKCAGVGIPCDTCGALDVNRDDQIDLADKDLLIGHINGDPKENAVKCQLSDCFFHGKHINRTENAMGWQWTFSYFPIKIGDEILTLTPFNAFGEKEVSGKEHNMNFKVKVTPSISNISRVPADKEIEIYEDVTVTIDTNKETNRLIFKEKLEGKETTLLPVDGKRIEHNGGWRWTITYKPTYIGDEVLTVIPVAIKGENRVEGAPKTLEFKVKVTPTIFSVSRTGADILEHGDRVTVNVDTNKVTDYLDITYALGGSLSTSNRVAYNGGWRYTFTYTANNIGDEVITITPLATIRGVNYPGESKSLSFKVQVSPEIISMTRTGASVLDPGDTITITVDTNAATSSIHVRFGLGGSLNTSNRVAYNGGWRYTFTYTANTIGTETIMAIPVATVNGKDYFGGSKSLSFRIELNPEIYSISRSGGSIEQGDSITITVDTNYETESIEAYCGLKGTTNSYTNRTLYNGGWRYTFSYYASKVGTEIITVTPKATWQGVTYSGGSKSISFYCESPAIYPSINSISGPGNINEGSFGTVTVYTNADTDYISVYSNLKGSSTTYTSRTSYGGGWKFTFSYYGSKSGSESLSITPYGTKNGTTYSGSSRSCSFSVIRSVPVDPPRITGSGFPTTSRWHGLGPINVYATGDATNITCSGGGSPLNLDSGIKGDANGKYLRTFIDPRERDLDAGTYRPTFRAVKVVNGTTYTSSSYSTSYTILADWFVYHVVNGEPCPQCGQRHY